MTEKKKIQLPQVPKPVGEAKVKVRKRVLKLEKRLSALTQRQLIILLTVVGLLTLLVGAALGFLLSVSQLTQPPAANQTSLLTNSQPETVSETGVLRAFGTPQNGIEFYLEKQDGTQVLLKTAGQIDPTFLESQFKDLMVTVEGTMTKSADGSKDILQVEKIVLKR